MSKKDLTFEKALERLEKIVADMESGDLSLDGMIAHFEEGQGLLKFCGGKLNEVERRIEVLIRKGNELVAEPFGDDPGGSAAQPSNPEPDGR